MIHAYQEIYLSKAQSVLGDAFDHAVNDCHISGDLFTKIFSSSDIGKQFEKGDPSVIAGMSGIEIAIEVIRKVTGREILAEPKVRYGRSAQYWIGWAVAYYQWWSDRTFGEIFTALPYDDLHKLYYTLHEADITKFTDIAESRIREVFPETNLKRIRTAYGCSQSELAHMSGVSLRSIQMYEQRNKDINKASAETLYRIVKVLGCDIEALLEK
ncbi:MAG: helix-turn-helix domain-containing protein [Lachnospiraceae bacterium]|nr:helix-turn-helix domain-containing protein [Candidatus Minthocola equi]